MTLLNKRARNLSAVRLEHILKLTVRLSRGRTSSRATVEIQTQVNIRLTLTVVSHVLHVQALTAHLLSQSARPPTAKRIKSTEPNSQCSNQAPLQNYNGTLTNAPAGNDSDNRFNLQYGGIMDDDIQEMTPLPVKASQVKVCLVTIAAHSYSSLE